MRTRLFAMAAAVLLAGCATSNGTRLAAPADESRPPSVDGPDLTAYLAVGGVTCPICAGSLKKVLERQAGIQRFAFDMNTGIGTVTFVEGRTVDLDAVKTATKRAGFDLKWTEIEVVGRVYHKVAGTEALALNLRSRNQEILILPGYEEEPRTKYTEVARWAGEAGKVLRIRGRAHSHVGGQIAMTIKAFEIVEEPSK